MQMLYYQDCFEIYVYVCYIFSLQGGCTGSGSGCDWTKSRSGQPAALNTRTDFGVTASENILK